MAGRKRLALMGLMVCLPIPLLAASGLAVPLPPVVYRVAVGVAERTQAVAVRVPGFEAVVTETKQVARRGKIRFSPEELAVAAKASGAVTSANGGRPRQTHRAPLAATRGVHRSATPKRPAARPLSVRRVSPAAADPELRSAVAAPANLETPRGSDKSAREERAPAKKDPAAEVPGNTSPRHPPETKTAPPRDEPRTSPPKQEPKNTTGPSPAPPPPPPPPPPASLPPLPVTPPIDPVPDPLPLTPKAQLETIAAELREIDDDDDGDRVAQAVEKVESAVERLEKTPPDKQGAVGDIKNAVQKLDAALSDGEIDVAQRTLYVTRLNAVSQQLKDGS